MVHGDYEKLSSVDIQNFDLTPPQNTHTHTQISKQEKKGYLKKCVICRWRSK